HRLAGPDHGGATRLSVVGRQRSARLHGLEPAEQRQGDDGHRGVQGGAVLMAALRTLTRRFAASTRGLAAVEFAMVVPILLIMLLATFDAGRAVAAYMKVRAATFTLASITNQYSTSTSGISTTVMPTITGASSSVLYPFSGTTVARISQIKA